MALDNLISLKFSDAEVNQIKSAISAINKVLKDKVINLTPEERRQYGSIADRNKILVDKCRDYMKQAPETKPNFLDMEEFEADYKARVQIEEPLRELARVIEKLTDTKTLLDHDNYNASVAYYRSVKFLSQQNVPGTSTIYKDLRKHYQTTNASSNNTEE